MTTMPDNKLTDNIKTTDWLVKGISKEQLDKERIQALKEQIEYLEAENERLERENKHYAELEQGCYVTGYKNIKAEAYKEFAEKLKNEIINDTAYACDSTQHSGYYDYQIKIGDIPEYIDNLLKEIIGE